MLAVVAAAALGLASLAIAPPAAHADACTNTGLQPRILATDDPSIVETQFCLSGTWTTVSVQRYQVDTTVITERVLDPVDSRLALAKAEAFFGVKGSDPYAVVSEAQKLVDAATRPSELVELRLAFVDARVQALKNRESTGRADGCRTRSRTYSSAMRHVGLGWDPPDSTGPPGQPSRIDYEFAPGVTREMKVVILNAIDQYAAAVAAQDAEGRYPTAIVPHDAADSRPATITFDVLEPGDSTLGDTKRDPFPLTAPGAAVQWRSGVIRLTSSPALVPMTVGHEIGHVLGLQHLPGHQHGTMDATGWPGEHADIPWSPHVGSDDVRSIAFDQCVFLPPVEPLL